MPTVPHSAPFNLTAALGSIYYVLQYITSVPDFARRSVPSHLLLETSKAEARDGLAEEIPTAPDELLRTKHPENGI